MTPIVFLDTETTSLRPDRRAWEIGMIRRDDRGQKECRLFVDMLNLDLPEADPFSLNVGRFWERHPQAAGQTVGARWDGDTVRDDVAVGDGPLGLFGLPDDTDHVVVSSGVAAAAVHAWTHRAHIVGAVPNFDTECLAALLRDNWLTPSWHYHLIDVETLAVGWLARKFDADAQSKAIPSGTAAQMRRAEFEPPWSSEGLSDALGVELPNEADRHTALGDARWAARVYDRVMGREEEQG